MESCIELHIYKKLDTLPHFSNQRVHRQNMLLYRNADSCEVEFDEPGLLKGQS